MTRRQFVQTVAGASLLTVAGELPAAPAPKSNADGKIRGVNLGGWLVLEKWITPTLFADTDAKDEWTFSQRPDGAARLKKHHATYITERDFAWIASVGLNSVRLPVGWWVLGDAPPYHAALDVVDNAFTWAARHDLTVLLDLHGAPGSQNGQDHSGKSGLLEWDKKPENIARTLDVLEALARRYGSRFNLLGLELLNEPWFDVPIPTLETFYKDAARRVRPHLPADKFVVFHDGFRSSQWTRAMLPAAEFSNLMLDAHLYHAFGDDGKMDIYGHVQRAAVQQKDNVSNLQSRFPTIVGEWSLAVQPNMMRDVSGFSRNVATRALADAQLLAYERGSGWYFWTYKTETAPEWSFRESVARDWLPRRFDGAR